MASRIVDLTGSHRMPALVHIRFRVVPTSARFAHYSHKNSKGALSGASAEPSNSDVTG